MARAERIIQKKRAITVTYEPMDELIESGRILFGALGPCPMWGEHDQRTGIEVRQKRSLVFFSWQMPLPDKRVFLTREMMGLR